jgi:protein-S-isoprenylcysteine O-methyltransferase Ste14
MNHAVLFLHLLNLLYIGLLPRIFFKKGGRYNAAWWLTAAPFLANTFLLLLAGAGILPFHWALPDPFRGQFTGLSVAFAAGSIALISYTLGTHRIPIALWHQESDAPEQIVTWGAYARIRHPFYAAFLLALVAQFLFLPHAGTFVSLLYGVWRLDATAAREEARLSASALGPEYREYLARTGRFWPRFAGNG